MSDYFAEARIERLATRAGFAHSIRVTIPPNGATKRTRHRQPFVVTVSERIELDREIWENGKCCIVHEVYEPGKPVYRPAGVDQRVINRSDQIVAFDKDSPPDGDVNAIGVFVAELAEPQDLAAAFPDPGQVEADLKFARARVPIDTLTTNVGDFLTAMGEVLESASDPVGDAWQIDEVIVAAEVSAKGAVSLVGTGGGAGKAESGLTFRLRRVGA
jgi:hypothetical protein